MNQQDVKVQRQVVPSHRRLDGPRHQQHADDAQWKNVVEGPVVKPVEKKKGGENGRHHEQCLNRQVFRGSPPGVYPPGARHGHRHGHPHESQHRVHN